MQLSPERPFLHERKRSRLKSGMGTGMHENWGSQVCAWGTQWPHRDILIDCVWLVSGLQDTIKYFTICGTHRCMEWCSKSLFCLSDSVDHKNAVVARTTISPREKTVSSEKWYGHRDAWKLGESGVCLGHPVTTQRHSDWLCLIGLGFTRHHKVFHHLWNS